MKSGGDKKIFVPLTPKSGGDVSPPSPPGLTPLNAICEIIPYHILQPPQTKYVGPSKTSNAYNLRRNLKREIHLHYLIVQ